MKQTILLLITSILYLSSCKTQTQEKKQEQVDLSESEFFPTLGNQGRVASCDWFAVVYYQMTYSYNRHYNRKASAGNTFSPKFGYNFLNNANIYPFNIRVDDVYKFVQKHGSATMAELPYDMANGTGFKKWCTDSVIWKNAIKYKTNGYSYFTYKNAARGADYSFEEHSAFFNEIKKLLNEGEVLVLQTNPAQGKSMYKKVIDDPSSADDDKFVGEHIIYSGNDGPDHTMALVGYNDNIWVDVNEDGKVQPEEKGALKIADSYGDDLIRNRNRGFIWMAYNTVQNSIFEHRINRMKILKNHQSKILCKITLNTSERDKIRFQFGRSVSPNPEEVGTDDSKVVDPYGLGYKLGTAGKSLIEGGNFAFDGSSVATNGSFVVDLTDIYNDNNSDYWYLKIENSGDKPLIIKEFELVDTQTGSITKDVSLPQTIVNSETYRFLKL